MMPTATVLATVIGGTQLPLAAFSLALARGIGLLQILPLSTRLGLTGMHRTGVAGALALLMVPMLVPQLGATPPGGARLALLAAKEGLIGFLLGVVFAVPFWIAESAGELIDQQRGSSSAVTPDPSGTETSGITATLLVLTLTTIFLVSGGMHWLIDALYRSYQVWPAGDLVPHLAPGAATQMLGLLDSVLGSGLLLASPLVVAMVIAELSLGFVNRFLPQLNVFDLSMSAKGLIQVIGLPVYAVFLIGYMRGHLAPLLYIEDEFRLLSGR